MLVHVLTTVMRVVPNCLKRSFELGYLCNFYEHVLSPLYRIAWFSCECKKQLKACRYFCNQLHVTASCTHLARSICSKFELIIFANQYILRLDISVNDVLFVDNL